MDEQKIATRQLQAIWITMAAPLMYLAVCELILRLGVHGAVYKGFAPLDPQTYNIVRIGAYVLSAFTTAILIRSRMAINEGSVTGLAAIFLKRVETSGDNAYTVAVQSFISLVAMCNTVAVFGVTLFLLNGIRMDSYMLMAAAFLLMFLYPPKKALLDKIAALKKS
jgi:hypothetical protein